MGRHGEPGRGRLPGGREGDIRHGRDDPARGRRDPGAGGHREPDVPRRLALARPEHLPRQRPADREGVAAQRAPAAGRAALLRHASEHGAGHRGSVCVRSSRCRRIRQAPRKGGPEERRSLRTRRHAGGERDPQHALYGGPARAGRRGAPQAPRPTRRGARAQRGLVGDSAGRMLRWVQLTGGAPSPNGADPRGHELYPRSWDAHVYEKTRTLLEPLDYLGLKLTGRVAATPASMILSWLTGNRPGAKPAYVPELVRRSGRDAARLPQLLPTGGVLGDVTVEAGGEIRVPRGARGWGLPGR